MEKIGLFRFGAVSIDTKILSQYPRDDVLIDTETANLLDKLDKSFPISVVEKRSHLYTVRSDKAANYIVMTDKAVDTSSCGAFLSELKKLWLAFYDSDSNKMTDEEIETTFDPKIKELIAKYNKDRKEEEQPEEPDHPEIILDEHKLPVDPDPVVRLEDSREEHLLPNNEQNTDLTITFNQEHYDESLTHLRLKICWQRHKIAILITIFIIVVSIIVMILICGGFNVSQCITKSKSK